ncbi:hypothetical protein [Tardiphaga sp. 619_E2_N8_5]|uniref:hypothetical protein n=1 Tax=unclassified Tardiphaga TaxID=2631404 RepID=UPI003F281C13
MDIFDYSWTFDERETAQYKHFVLLGSKGMTQAYPTAAMENTQQFYSREEALAHATLAAKAPEMLRLLRSVEKSLQILSVDDVGAQRLLEQLQAGITKIVAPPRASV